MSKTAKYNRVICLLYEGVQMIDAIGPVDVFKQAEFRTGQSSEFVYAATQSEIRANNGMVIKAEVLPLIIRSTDLVLIPGGMPAAVDAASSNSKLLRWLKYAASEAGLVATVCTGAILLARTGLLEGRQVTTHWAATQILQDAAPNARIDARAIFIEDGKTWTSAGVTTGIDMALAMIGRIHGPDIAARIARDMVMHMTRAGNQSQFSSLLDLQVQAGPDLAGLIPWLEANLADNITVEKMADIVGLSERQFHRRCVEHFDQTPGRLVRLMRLERARQQLQRPGERIDQIILKCGFGDAASFAKSFKREYGLSPKHYQKSWTQEHA